MRISNYGMSEFDIDKKLADVLQIMFSSKNADQIHNLISKFEEHDSSSSPYNFNAWLKIKMKGGAK